MFQRDATGSFICLCQGVAESRYGLILHRYAEVVLVKSVYVRVFSSSNAGLQMEWEIYQG